jgi:hypothetical protein
MAKPAQNIPPITKAPVPTAKSSSSECSPPYEETSNNEIENDEEYQEFFAS